MQSPHQQCCISASDVAVDNRANPSYLTVTLRHSKTDPFGNGVTIYLGRSDTHVCPVSAMLAYLAIRPSIPGPLFIHSNSRPLSRAQLVAAIRAALDRFGLDTSQYSGHSFRIGATSAAAQAGLPDSLIQILGRWQSSAFLSYLRTPRERLLPVAALLASPQGNCRQSSQ